MASPLSWENFDDQLPTAQEISASRLRAGGPFLGAVASGQATDEFGQYRGQELEALAAGDQQGAEMARMGAARVSPLRNSISASTPRTFEEANARGEYAPYVTQVLGSMAQSMERPMLGGVAGSLLGGPLGAAAGAYAGSYNTIRPATLAGYADDPEIAALAPEEQLSMARNSSLLQAAPEALLPTFLASGARLPGAILRAPTALRAAGAVAGEAGTEGLQDYIGQRVVQEQFPNRPLDTASIRESAIAGAIGGGAANTVFGPGKAAEPEPQVVPPERQVPDPNTPLLPGPAPSGFGAKLREKMDAAKSYVSGNRAPGAPVPLDDGPDAGEQTRFEALRTQAMDKAGRAKDYVTAFAGKAKVAAKTSNNAGDFIRTLFGDPADDAANDLRPDDQDPAVRNAPDVGAALQERDANKAKNSARYAEELLNNEKTPASVKERIAAFNGDYSSPEAQGFVAKRLVMQRANEKARDAVNDLIEAGRKVKDSLAEKFNDTDISGALQAGKNVASDLFNRGKGAVTEAIDDRDISGAVQAGKNVAGDLLARGKDAVTGAYEGTDIAGAARSASNVTSDMASKLGTKVAGSTLLGKAVRGATGLITKNNLMDVSDVEQETYEKLVYEDLTDLAKNSEDVRAQLPQLANALLAIATRTGELDKDDINTLLRAQDGMGLFKDPEATAAKLLKFAGQDVSEDSFLFRIKKITNAQKDTRTEATYESSFLYKALGDDARVKLSHEGVKRVARLVDEFSVRENAGDGDAALAALTVAFGGKANALQVLEYYKRQNVANIGYMEDKVDPIDDKRVLPERDAPIEDAYYADPKSKRPFYNEREARTTVAGGMRKRMGDVNQFIDRMRGRGVELRAQSMKEFAAETKLDPAEEVSRIRADLEGRIKEAAPRKREDPEYAKNRADTRMDLEAQLSALKLINESEGPEAALDLFRVARARGEKNELGITDAQLAESDVLLRRKVNPNAPPQGMSKWEANRKNEAIDKTKIVFNKTDGGTLALSAESLWKAYQKSQQSGSTPRQLFADALSAVLNRPDIAGIKGGQAALREVLIDRDSWTFAEAFSDPNLAAAKAELAGKYEDVLAKAEKDVAKRVAKAEALLDSDTETDVAVERISEWVDTMQYRIGVLRRDAKELREEAKQLKSTEIEEKLELRASASWLTDIAGVYSSGVSMLREMGYEANAEAGTRKEAGDSMYARSEIDAIDAERSILERDFGNLTKVIRAGKATDKQKRRMDAVKARFKELDLKEAAIATNAKGYERGTGREGRATPRRYDESTGAALHPDNKVVDRTPPGTLGKQLDAVLLANPELLQVFDGRGRPKDKNMSESRMRERLFEATRGLSAAKLEERLEGLRAELAVAVDARDKQQIAALKTMDEMLSYVAAKAKQKSEAATKASSRDEELAEQYGGGRDEASAERYEEEATNAAPAAKAPASARVVLPKTSPFTAKDQAKSDQANKFIGRGSKGSSTAAYAEAWGDRANTGKYTKNDVVFISVNGKRAGAIAPQWPEIKRAIDAGATLITDKPADRAREYNEGERNVAAFLTRNGYFEVAPGEWATPKAAAEEARIEKGADAAILKSADAPRSAATKPAKKYGPPLSAEKSEDMAYDMLTEEQAEALAQNGESVDVAEGQFFMGHVGEDPALLFRPLLPDTVTKKSFVGAKADPSGAAYAELALDAGTSAEAVWSQLGWFRGPDGKLRKEIRSPVLKARVRKLAQDYADDIDGTKTLKEMLAGVPEFVEYLSGPVGEVEISLNDFLAEVGSAGVYLADAKEIQVSFKGAKFAALIDRVGIAKAKNLFASRSDINDAADMIEALQKELKLSNNEVDALGIAELQSFILHEMQHVFQGHEGFENGGDSTTAVVTKYGDVDAYKQAIAAKDTDALRRIEAEAQAALAAEYSEHAYFDPALVAHDLYNNIIGEVEANDVQARMNLSDAEAASLKPALMDAKRKFLRSVFTSVAMSQIRGASKIGAKPGRPSRARTKVQADRKAVIEEIQRLRGKDIKIRMNKLVSELKGSGAYVFNTTTGKRLIEVAINAESVLGTARHEAMHDFFRFLSESPATRSAAKDLLAAAGAPHVVKKLRELLAKHPKALEQLNDPEERAAYAYQFWVENLVQMGPASTGVFQTIRQFLRDMFGIVTKGQRADDLLRAFHDGRFADPSVVQEVLQDLADKNGTTFSDKMERVAPALTDALTKLAAVPGNRLRSFQNTKLTELADEMEKFVDNRSQQQNLWENRLAKILEGTDAVARRKAIDEAQSRVDPTTPLGVEMKKFFKDMHAYMSEAKVKTFNPDAAKGEDPWVPLREVENFFPRRWDPDAIARDRSGFQELLVREGKMSPASAILLTDNLINGREHRPPMEVDLDLGFMPFAESTSARVLNFIKPTNAKDFSKFEMKDMADILSSYVRQATHRAEYARAFDNDGAKIVQKISQSKVSKPDELKDISNSVQALEGSLDPGKWSRSTKEMMSSALTVQNVILLPLSLFAQMIDPIVLAARSGDIKDAGRAFIAGVKGVAGKKVPGEELADILGIASRDSMLQAMGQANSAARMSKRTQRVNQLFFKYNGMQGWNNAMRSAATAAGERYLKANKDNKAALEELGLKVGDVQFDRFDNLVVTKPEVQQAMFKFVDQSVLRPSASNRAVWMSDPRFQLVSHLKQFTFAMHNVVLKRASKELVNGNKKPWATLMLAMPVILASDMVKFALTGGLPDSWMFKDYLMHSVERSGLLGLGDFGVQAMGNVDAGRAPGERLLGPTLEHLMTILRWIGGDPRIDGGDVVDRTVPFAKFV